MVFGNQPKADANHFPLHTVKKAVGGTGHFEVVATKTGKRRWQRSTKPLNDKPMLAKFRKSARKSTGKAKRRSSGKGKAKRRSSGKGKKRSAGKSKRRSSGKGKKRSAGKSKRRSSGKSRASKKGRVMKRVKTAWKKLSASTRKRWSAKKVMRKGRRLGGFAIYYAENAKKFASKKKSAPKRRSGGKKKRSSSSKRRSSGKRAGKGRSRMSSGKGRNRKSSGKSKKRSAGKRARKSGGKSKRKMAPAVQRRVDATKRYKPKWAKMTDAQKQKYGKNYVKFINAMLAEEDSGKRSRTSARKSSAARKSSGKRSTARRARKSSGKGRKSSGKGRSMKPAMRERAAAMKKYSPEWAGMSQTQKDKYGNYMAFVNAMLAKHGGASAKKSARKSSGRASSTRRKSSSGKASKITEAAWRAAVEAAIGHGEDIDITASSSARDIARALENGVVLPLSVRRRLPRHWEDIAAGAMIAGTMDHVRQNASVIGRHLENTPKGKEHRKRIAELEKLARETRGRKKSEVKKARAKAVAEVLAEEDLGAETESDSDFQIDDDISVLSRKQENAVRNAKVLAGAKASAENSLEVSRIRSKEPKRGPRRVALQTITNYNGAGNMVL